MSAHSYTNKEGFKTIEQQHPQPHKLKAVLRLEVENSALL